jgi:cyanophycinase
LANQPVNETDYMKQIKGILVPIGGAENKGDKGDEDLSHSEFIHFFEEGILRQLLNLVEGRSHPVIELITTASSYPEEVANTYIEAFKKLGCERVGAIDIRERQDVLNEEYFERLKTCDCILFTGGDQLKLSTILGGSAILELIKSRYHREAVVIAGTSAGAMAMSNVMIYEGDATQAHLSGEVKMANGFGFIQNIIIDTHFEKRGRFNRLAQAVATQPGILGIGLAEDTGVIIKDGKLLKVIGSGIVTVLDGRNINYTNLADIKPGQPISVHQLITHIASEGSCFNIFSRQFQPIV